MLNFAPFISYSRQMKPLPESLIWESEVHFDNKKELDAYNLFSNRIETEMEFFKLYGLSDEAIGKAIKNLYRKAIEMGYIESVIKK